MFEIPYHLLYFHILFLEKSNMHQKLFKLTEKIVKITFINYFGCVCAIRLITLLYEKLG